jgi:hypothetical protein
VVAGLLAPVVTGRDARDVGAVWAAMHRAARNVGTTGTPRRGRGWHVRIDQAPFDGCLAPEPGGTLRPDRTLGRKRVGDQAIRRRGMANR